MRTLISVAVLAIILASAWGAYRLLQRRRAADRGVLGETLIDRLDGGILDVLRGVEIRFARAQPDDVLTFTRLGNSKMTPEQECGNAAS